ncbi:hypothetical protein CVT24_003891 [Panaeolus cyanescens]|uniref:Uncharacterized protein n=1 Tax=Panaeolus cyanescens TaxID=181874 RepID=A0A409VV75_9AGAR|nr:hypothetical protein CVT24_003891 [Panaeolus cyanescens]
MAYSRFLWVLKRMLIPFEPSNSQLPYEIWRIIYYLLPKDYRLTLYSVNSALFNLVMHEMYSNLDLRPQRGALSFDTRYFVANLSSFAFKQVKSLALEPDIEHEEPKPLPFWSRLVDCITLQPVLKEMVSWNMELIPTRIPKMTALSSLKIEYPALKYSRTRFQKFIQPRRARWIVPSSLSKLELNLPLDLVHLTLHSAPIFQHLEELILTLIDKPPYEQPLVTDVAKLVNEKCSNITKLGVHNASDAVDPFFASLLPLPHLSSLSFIWPSHYAQVSVLRGCHSFLSAHADALRTVTLDIDYDLRYRPLRSNNEITSHPIFRISLPRLTNLTLWPTFSISSNAITTSFLEQHIGSFIQTLTQLHMPNSSLQENEIPKIVRLVGGHSSHLRVLQMNVQSFRCKLLELFCGCCPSLEVLELTFSDLATGDPPKVIERPLTYDWRDWSPDRHRDKYIEIIGLFEPFFCEEMDKYDYSQWGIQRLHLGFKPIDCRSEAPNYDPFRGPLARAMSSLISFNGEEIWRDRDIDANKFSASR